LEQIKLKGEEDGSDERNKWQQQQKINGGFIGKKELHIGCTVRLLD
jgi:hypothetical protein